jgi:hypothetical protein
MTSHVLRQAAVRQMREAAADEAFQPASQSFLFQQLFDQKGAAASISPRKRG